MVKHIGSLIISVILFISCGKDNDDITYPRKFIYNKSELAKEKGFVIGDNESFSEISPDAGNLNILRTNVVLNYSYFVKDSIQGLFLESFELLSKDSIRLEFSFDGDKQFVTMPADVDNIDGMIIDPGLLGTTVIWDKVKQELRYCIAIDLGIIKRGNQVLGDVAVDFCSSNDINTELQRVLLEDDYVKNDTVGIYLLDMFYK